MSKLTTVLSGSPGVTPDPDVRQSVINVVRAVMRHQYFLRVSRVPIDTDLHFAAIRQRRLADYVQRPRDCGEFHLFAFT